MLKTPPAVESPNSCRTQPPSTGTEIGNHLSCSTRRVLSPRPAPPLAPLHVSTVPRREARPGPPAAAPRSATAPHGVCYPATARVSRCAESRGVASSRRRDLRPHRRGLPPDHDGRPSYRCRHDSTRPERNRCPVQRDLPSRDEPHELKKRNQPQHDYRYPSERFHHSSATALITVGSRRLRSTT
jgi:hypothetical protein